MSADVSRDCDVVYGEERSWSGLNRKLIPPNHISSNPLIELMWFGAINFKHCSVYAAHPFVWEFFFFITMSVAPMARGCALAATATAPCFWISWIRPCSSTCFARSNVNIDRHVIQTVKLIPVAFLLSRRRQIQVREGIPSRKWVTISSLVQEWKN